MGKLRQTALILGEGPTEFFYFKSLCDVFKRLTIKPDYPKHTNIKELDAKIAEGVAMGYNHIFCIIDMDTGKGACVCPLRARGTAPFWHDKIDPSGQDKNDPCR